LNTKEHNTLLKHELYSNYLGARQMTKLFLHLQLVPHTEQSMRKRFFGLSVNLTQNRGVTQSHFGY